MELIEELYNENMWVTDLHKELLEKHVNEDGWDERKILEVLAVSSEGAKKNFLKVFERMGNKKTYYEIKKNIFKVGVASVVEITCKYNFQKLVGNYKVYISPVYNYDFHTSIKFEPFTLNLEANENMISIPYCFKHEDLYNINIFYIMDGKEYLLLSTSVYALDEDLYGKQLYKADFHMHTTYSDGYEPPELVVSSARRAGMDIVAVTDHNNFQGSVVARTKAREMGLDLTVISGEEYSLEYSPMHILSLGTKKPIERKYLTKQVCDMEDTKKIISECANLSCDKEAYACTQVLLDEVRRIGGISILAHPYWKPIAMNGTRMDTPENLYIELGKDKRFSGIELVSGSQEGEYNVSNLQALLARDILGDFDGVPIIGITDSHYYTSDPICGKHYTIVIADDKEEKNVLNALNEGNCVAVEIAGNIPLCYGKHRLVKFAQFLVKYYFPKRDKAAAQAAELIAENFLYTEVNK